MPHTINSIGTRYSGKRNCRRQFGACEHCGRLGRLESFDSTLFFVIFFLPLIPLRKVRVLDVCPACKSHRVVKLREWERARATEVVEAVLALERSPGDADIAERAMALCIIYQDEVALQALARLIEDHQKSSAQLMLMLGMAHEYFGANEEAERAYLASMELRDDDEVRKRLGSLLICTGRVDEGIALIERLMSSSTLADAAWGYIAVEGLQAHARHDEAAEILTDLDNRFPQLARDKSHRSTWKSVRKGQRSGRKVVTPLMKYGATVEMKERRLASRLPWLVGPGLAMVVFFIYLAVAFSEGRSREVIVLNALDRAYTVDVGGTTASIPGGGFRRIRVPEGSHPVRITSPGFVIPDQVVDIQTPFWLRPFTTYTMILNPDRTAMIVWEEIAYSQSGRATSRHPPRLHIADLLTVFTGVDYMFVPSPSSISTSGNVEYRHRIYQLPLTLDVVGAVVAELGHDDTLDFLKRLIIYGSGEETPYMLARAVLPDDEVLQLISPLLSHRPPHVEHHRLYQDATQRIHPEHDLVAEYRALLSHEPADPALHYLLGRITPDRIEGHELLTAAAAAVPPVPYALVALAYNALSEGDFESARAAAARGCELEPWRRSFQDYHLEALHALGRFDECLASPHFTIPVNDHAEHTLLNRLYFLIRAGREGEAQSDLASYCDMLTAGFGHESSEETRRAADALMAYMRGDELAFAALVEIDAPESFVAAIARRDVRSALALAANDEDTGDWQFAATAAILALSEGDDDASAQALEVAAARLRENRAEERRAASWLTSEAAPALEDVLTLSLWIEDKRLILTLIGLRYPELRDPCFDLARTLNYDLRFPHLLIKRAVGQ